MGIFDKMPKNSVSICFLSLRAYTLLSGKGFKEVKGPNVRQVILAKELIKRGFNVDFICYDSDLNNDIEYINSIRVLKIEEKNNIPIFLRKIIDVYKILRSILKSDSDIYIHTGGFLGVLTILARKKNIFMVASDAWIDKSIVTEEIKEYNPSRWDLDNIGTYISIKKSDRVIVQNSFQKKGLQNIFNVGGVLIKNPLVIKKTKRIKKADPPIILWVGSMAEVKQPHLFVELAKRIPEANFQMIGGKSNNPKLYEKIKEHTKNLNNFEYVGVVPFNEINKYFSRASILVNTSLFEGFPTSFAQAWVNNVPVVSLNVDPDNLLSDYGLGFYSKNFEQLIKDIKRLMNNTDLRIKMGTHAHSYAEKEHNASVIVKEYIDIINSLFEKN